MDHTALAARLAQEEGLLLGVLFGSMARGTGHAHSDLDLGLRFSETPSATQLGSLVADLEALSVRPVDIVLLDEAGPSLCHRVAREGVVLHASHRDEWVHFVTRAIIRYLDWKPMEERFTRAVLERAADG